MSNVIQFDETIKWSIGGQDYYVKKPSVKTLQLFHEKHKSVGEDLGSQLDLTIDFLAEQGLPAEISGRLNSEQIAGIVESITGAKKKA